MNTKNILLLISTAAFSFLFYQQSPGLNFLLFNMLLLILVTVRDPAVWKERAFIAITILSLCASGSVLLYGNAIGVLASLVTVFLLSGYSMYSRNSILITAFTSLVSYITRIFADIFIREKSEKPVEETEQKPKRPFGAIWLTVGLPVAVTVLFFLFYRGSNPLFANLTSQISFGWISFTWMMVTLLGFWFSYGFFGYRSIPELAGFELLIPSRLDVGSYKGTPTFPTLGIDREALSGIVMLSLVNGLLLVVNGLDVAYLFLIDGLPEGMSYSDSVHQGIGNLITSIIVAVAIILFYFKGDLNFHPQSRLLKALGYVWVAQNLFMLISTAYRNHLYVEEYFLTYKRIGVYIYLALAFVGLALTVWKIFRSSTNWQLIRNSSWAFLVVLVLCCTVNWDRLIAQYNISTAIRTEKPIDYSYLNWLSYRAFPIIMERPPEADSHPGKVFHAYLFQFLNQNDEPNEDWRSLVLTKEWTREEIRQKHEAGQVNDVNLSNWHGIVTTAPQEMQHIQKVYLRLQRSHTGNQDWEGYEDLRSLTIDGHKSGAGMFYNFKGVEQLNSLSLNFGHPADMQNLHTLKALKSLAICHTPMNKLESNDLPRTITRLNVSDNHLVNCNFALGVPKLQYLDLRGNPISDYSALASLTQLKTLMIDPSNPYEAELQELLPNTKIIQKTRPQHAS